jgi:hypothetical protein
VSPKVAVVVVAVESDALREHGETSKVDIVNPNLGVVQNQNGIQQTIPRIFAGD